MFPDQGDIFYWKTFNLNLFLLLWVKYTVFFFKFWSDLTSLSSNFRLAVQGRFFIFCHNLANCPHNRLRPNSSMRPETHSHLRPAHHNLRLLVRLALHSLKNKNNLELNIVFVHLLQIIYTMHSSQWKKLNSNFFLKCHSQPI